jgi:alginate O-acetyltransferase complex protein AlgI
MVFSSLFFLFYFLPVILVSYFATPAKLRNLHLLLASLFFYAWGEGLYILLMLFVITVNYIIGMSFDKSAAATRRRLLIFGIGVNLIPLLFYKYSGFFLENLGIPLKAVAITSLVPENGIHLPLGISFFTFQAMSYLIDTYRGTTASQKNPINLALYITVFPQLIAGPIVRYHDISRQINKRRVSLDDFSLGVERFIVGLAKKVLLANPLGQMADIVFKLPSSELSTAAVWIGAVSYALQIYYDFSGYSDMAIGLGRMFGFTFLENFDFPYISKSIQEFWRRWHISLSNWFRDYLYIPLGGNRKGPRRTIINLFIVFFLCGLWHGASWNFVFWGLFHGFFLAIERGRWGNVLARTPEIIRHAYVLLVVLVGWIFFRAETFSQATEFVGILFGLQETTLLSYAVLMRLDSLFLLTFCFAVFFMAPSVPFLYKKAQRSEHGVLLQIVKTHHLVRLFCLCSIFTLSVASLASGVYNPFIYFRF